MTAKQRHYFADKGLTSQNYGFSGSHVQMWELDHKEGWVLKNWCFWTVVLEKTLESPLDWKNKPVNPKGNQSWIFIGRTDIEAETSIPWPPDAKNWLISKDPGAGKDWRQDEKETTENEMVGWHHCLDGHEFEQVLGVGDGLGNLVCCSPWGCKELDMTEQWTELTERSLPLHSQSTLGGGRLVNVTFVFANFCLWSYTSIFPQRLRDSDIIFFLYYHFWLLYSKGTSLISLLKRFLCCKMHNSVAVHVIPKEQRRIFNGNFSTVNALR